MKLLAFLILFFASLAHAEPFAAVGAQVEFATASDGRSMTTDQPLSLQLGWRFNQLDVFGEYSFYSATDGDNAVTVSRFHQEGLLWLRYAFLKAKVTPFIGAAGGFEADTVTTTLPAQKSQSTGAAQFEAAAALGVEINVWENLDLRFEGRMKSAPDLAPNPLLGLGASIGWRFK